MVARSMPTTRTKRARLEARVTPEQKRLFERAAQLMGSSLTDFLVSSAQEKAQETIRAHEVIQLTASESARFVEALLNPPAPSERLQAAAARSRALLGE